jgi:TnpA family transposase
MSGAGLLGFDLCPRLQELSERKLFLPPGFDVREGIERATAKRLSRKAIREGWDDLMRVVASIRIGSSEPTLRCVYSALPRRATRHIGRQTIWVACCAASSCATTPRFPTSGARSTPC